MISALTAGGGAFSPKRMLITTAGLSRQTCSITAISTRMQPSGDSVKEVFSHTMATVDSLSIDMRRVKASIFYLI
jgi:hypothetical protein